MMRYNLTIRRITSSGRTLPKNCIEKIKSYLDLVQEIVKDYEPKCVLGFDETSCYMGSFGNYSIEPKGQKRTFVQTSGKGKVRLSCLFTATASGDKLPILCVVPRKKKIANLDLGDGIMHIYETNGKSDFLLIVL